MSGLKDDDPLGIIINQSRSNYRPIIITLIFTFVFLAWLFWASLVDGIGYFIADRRNREELGQWGDSFGGFNALFGALGSAAIFLTLYLQYKSLEQQRKDSYYQRFEGKFFEILALIRQLRSELYFNQSREMKQHKNKKLVSMKGQTGFEAIKFAYFEVRHFVIAELRDRKSDDVKKIASDVYLRRIHNRFESRFSPYFRLIYTILSTIWNDKVLTFEEKCYFGNIIRSQMTSHEIYMLAINATAPVANDLDKYIVRFRLLKYVPSGPNRALLKMIYRKEAFLGRDDLQE